MKTIVMTGSFNPVTRAHYQIMSDAVAKVNADEGIFIATNRHYLTRKSLLKAETPTNFILSEEVRGQMLASLSASNPKLSFGGYEIGGSSPDTYRTLLRLIRNKKKQYPREEIKLYFLFGADKLKKIPNWPGAAEMSDLCDYLVYTRNVDVDALINANSFLSDRKDRIHVMQVADDDLEDVSSTEVRRRFFAGEDYRDMMEEGPYEVLQTFSPADFPPVTPEDIIKAQLKYDGPNGLKDACETVYKANLGLFKEWNSADYRKATPYTKPFTVNVPAQAAPTTFDCVNADCVDVAQELLAEGLHPAILNLASRTSPGGGYHKGTHAQEESLCQTSTLSQSLYQYGDPEDDHIRESSVTTVPGIYPMDINHGGIYSPNVHFFRHNKLKSFALRENDEIFDCPVVSVASLSNRQKNTYNRYDERCYFREDGYLTDDGREIERKKIRTLFRIALINGHDSMVLGAFGCGVFNLKCDEVAGLFRAVLEEPEFKNRFKKLVFAILEGTPSSRSRNPRGKDGKFAPFYETFGK